jgi:hypothetical protein
VKLFLGLLGVLLAGGVFLALSSTGTAQTAPVGLFFAEGFEDTNLTKRGWYDGSQFVLSDAESVAGRRSIRFHFPRGQIIPPDCRGARRRFDPTEVVYLRFYQKLSPGWGWTNRAYGPHLMLFMTTANGAYDGPAATHLTLYVEPVNGKLRLAAQDIQNKDQPHGLTQGPLRGGYNGRFYDSKEVLFDDGKWHLVEAMFQLNRLDRARDRPIPDGVLRGWVDGKLAVERTDVIFRSTDFPDMKLNQFLMLPYFHHGVPRDQTLWIDALAVGTRRIGPATERESR